MERETGVLNDAGIRGLPKPPWTELGYPSPTGARGRFNWTLFSGSTYLWLSGFGVLLILGQVRKAVIRARHRKSIENRDE